MTDGDPDSPNTSARAVHSAALDERPEPTGRLDWMVRVPPESGLARATIAPMSRAQGGVTAAMDEASDEMSTGSSALPRNASDVTSRVRRSLGVNMAVTPSPMAMGSASPWL